MRFLTPYALPIALGGAALLTALTAALWISVKSHAKTRMELNEANDRIHNIKAGQEIGNEVENMGSDAIASDLDKRLSDGGR